MLRKILVMGLPGAGKTTLTNLLAPALNAVVFNADAVRQHISKDLGYNHEDRIEQARRVGWMCDRVVEAGHTAIADLVCPTDETRDAFGDAFVIWVDRISVSRFEDTNQMFIPPRQYYMRVTAGAPTHEWAKLLLLELRPVFIPRLKTALFVGRYQPFHKGHQTLIEEGIRRTGQVCIAVRDVERDDKNPYTFHEVKQRIEAALAIHVGRFTVIQVPNISDIFYGREVGYNIERIVLDEETESISATKLRKLTQGVA